MKEKAAFCIKTLKVVTYLLSFKRQSKLSSVLCLSGGGVLHSSPVLLCFVLGAKPVLVTPQCFGYYWGVGVSRLSLHKPSPTADQQGGGGQEAGKGHSLESRPKLA